MTKKLTLGGLAVFLMAGVIMFASVASAATIVTPSNTQGWSSSGTTAGGQVNFVTDASSPYPNGALQLMTDSNLSATAQYMHGANTMLSSTTEISYWTKKISGLKAAAPSFQLMVDLNGNGTTTSGATTLVFSPAENGTVTTGNWQQWDVDAGQFWSTQTFSAATGTCMVSAGSVGGPFYTLSGLMSTCPDATIQGFAVKAGTSSPLLNAYVDGVNFMGTIYDFQTTGTTSDTTPPPVPTHVSPANGATTTTAALDKVDWTDVTDPSSPVTYRYQASLSSATTSTGEFASPIYTSGVLTQSEISTNNTPEATYYWHVMAVDAAGNMSAWSPTWSFTVDNGDNPPPPPGDHPMNKDECKNGGWRTFTDPSFRNQGQCVSWVNHNIDNDDDDDEEDDNDGNSGSNRGGNGNGNGNGNRGRR